MMTDYPNIRATLIELYKLQEEIEQMEPRLTKNMKYALDDAITILKELQLPLRK